MSTSICAAIATRSVIKFRYDGAVRIVEPHCHGRSRAGNEVLRAYQVGGGSDSGESRGWKLFEISKMSVVEDTGESFPSNGPGYNTHDRAMVSIHCSV